MTERTYNIAILGATGAVGTRLMSQLEESTIPVNSLKLLASARSAGKKLTFKGQELTVEEATVLVALIWYWLLEVVLYRNVLHRKQLNVAQLWWIIQVIGV